MDKLLLKRKILILALFLMHQISFCQVVILDENFDSVIGSGGNDATWSGSVANSALNSFESWDLIKVYKGDQCLKLGTGSMRGIAQTPVLESLNGTATLTFRAGAWNGANEKLKLKLEISGGGVLSVDEVSLVKGAFSDYSVEIYGGTPASQISFKGQTASNSRFFLDDVLIISGGEEVIDVPVISTHSVQGIYGVELHDTLIVLNEPHSYNLSGDLPNGISFSNGVFSGVPNESGVFTVSIVATNDLGASEATLITIVIDKAEQIVFDLNNVLIPLSDGTYLLPPKSSADLDLLYSIEDASIAFLQENVLHLLSEGTTYINVHQPGTNNYHEFEATISLVIYSSGDECGTESFEDVYLSNSYSDGSFIGANGVGWSFVSARNENNDANESGIDGPAIMLRNSATGSKITSSVLTNGIGSFSVKLYKGFTSSGNRQIEVFVNGVSLGVSEPFDDYEEHVFSIEEINLTGEAILEVRNIKSGQIILDDISWTCYAESNNDITIWDGESWSNGIPNNDLNAVIQADYQEDVDLYAKTLKIESGVNFTLNTGLVLRTGSIINDGEFSISNNAYVLQTNESINSGLVKVLVHSDSLKRLDYMVVGAPVLEQNLYDFSPETLENRFYRYDSFTDSFVNEGINSSTSFEIGKAFAIRTPNTFSDQAQVFIGEFNGSLNNGLLTGSVSTLGQGFNLLSNPYASIFDLDVFFDNNPHLDGSAYLYVNSNSFDVNADTYTGNNYAVYNKTGAVSADNSDWIPTNLLPTAKGFIVKANSNIDVIFTNDMRKVPVQNQLSVLENNVKKDKLWLSLYDSDQNENKMLVGFLEGATNSKDRFFDAMQIAQNSNSLTSLIDGEPYIIQGRTLFQESDIVPLRIEIIKSGKYKIKLTKSKGIFLDDQDVYLFDQLLNETINLKNQVYEFDSEAGVFDERFSIVFQNISLGINEQESIDKNINLFQRDKKLIIDASESRIGSIRILDIKGVKLLDLNSLNSNYIEIPYESYSRGIYIIEIHIEGLGDVINKVFF